MLLLGVCRWNAVKSATISSFQILTYSQFKTICFHLIRHYNPSEKLTVVQIPKKLPTHYGIQSFIAVFTENRTLGPEPNKCNQQPCKASVFRSTVIFSSHINLVPAKALFLITKHSYKTFIFIFIVSYACCIPCSLSSFILAFDEHKLRSSSFCSFLIHRVTSTFLGTIENYFRLISSTDTPLLTQLFFFFFH